MTIEFHRVLSMGLICVAVLISSEALGAPLTLKRVMLSSGGVGYFEHETVIEGNAEVRLEVRLDQVDDVLKSLVVYDDAGSVATIDLPGREPLAQVFRDLPFSQDALNSPLALFNALQGSEVEVSGARRVKGRILRVVPEVTTLSGNGSTVTHHRISLLTVDGVRHFLFEDAEAVRFTDPTLAREVDRALEATARHRLRDRRTLSIGFTGKGRRVVRVGYVTGVPLWKSTYRLTLDQNNGARRALLQGWAVVENMSGHDWSDVELSLVSGNPVTLRQAVYTAYYVNRPSVPVEVLGRVLPSPDTGSLGRAASALSRENERPLPPARAMASQAMSEQPLPFSAPAEGTKASGGLADLAEPAAVAATEDLAAQVLFRLPTPVNARVGQSLVVPIVNQTFPAERVALYKQELHSVHPLATVQLVNDGSSALPPGILTLYERQSGETLAYVGDARLATFPPGDERLVSFAVDQPTRIGREVQTVRTVAKAAIDRGVLRLTVIQREITTYRIKTSEQQGRQLLIEHPRRPDWKLVAPKGGDITLTEERYRIPFHVLMGSESMLEVQLERPDLEHIQIQSLSLARLLAYARSSELDDAMRQAFAELAAIQREVDASRQRIERLTAVKREIYQDQRRLRDNLSRIPDGSDLHNRYVQKLDYQESQLEQLDAQLKQSERELEESTKRLADNIGTMRM